MEKVLVSACLLGDPVRYDGDHKRSDHEILARWVDQGRVVPVCPEVAGGLPVPRPPAEVADGASGEAVLDGWARVVDFEARDVTAHFVQGAEVALALARSHSIRVAILKENSPSCGTGLIYDGTFTGNKVPGFGVTAALLRQHGIQVFGETQLAEAARVLLSLEGAPR